MTSFTRTFGGQVVSPTSVSYATYTSVVSLVLEWPFQTPANGNVLAWQNDVAFTALSQTLTLPDATLVSVGASFLINNTGAQSFTVLGGDGLTNVVNIASGQQWYLYLVDNTTAGGSWRAIQFGTGTSSASAASLAGAGLIAVVTKLNQNLIIQPKSGNYSPVIGDLATVLQSLGGSVVWTPGSAATFGNGWFVYVINDGSGTLTWTPSGGQLIDNAATKVFQPTESAVIFSDGTNFWSLGYGRSITSTVTGVSVDLTGTGTTDLTANQVAAQVQDFSGTLTGPRIVEYGTGVGYWFVRNNTTGAGGVTFRVNGSDAGVSVAQGSFSILRSNGSNMAIAFTASTGTVTSVATTANLTGGPITTTGTLDLSDTTVVPGTVGSNAAVPVVTVDQKGRVTALTSAALGSSAAINTSAAAGLADANLVLKLDSNGLVPSVNGGLQVGDLVMSFATSKAGFVFANAQTIGSAASAATQRANADTANLYALLWTNCSNTVCPVSSGRGGSAAADFAANKTLGLPDMRGTVPGGLDNAGGAASAGRLSSLFGSTAMGASLSNSGTVTGVSSSVSVSGNVTVSSGGVGLVASGTITGVTAVVQGGGGTTVGGLGDPVSVSGTTNPITSNGANTLFGTGTSGAFGIAQSTMVMNPFLKL